MMEKVQKACSFVKKVSQKSKQRSHLIYLFRTGHVALMPPEWLAAKACLDDLNDKVLASSWKPEDFGASFFDCPHIGHLSKKWRELVRFKELPLIDETKSVDVWKGEAREVTKDDEHDKNETRRAWSRFASPSKCV